MMFENEIRLMKKSCIIDVEIIFSQEECMPVFTDNEIHYEYVPGRKGYIDKVIEDKQEHLAHIIRDSSAHM